MVVGIAGERMSELQGKTDLSQCRKKGMGKIT